MCFLILQKSCQLNKTQSTRNHVTREIFFRRIDRLDQKLKRHKSNRNRGGRGRGALRMRSPPPPAVDCGTQEAAKFVPESVRCQCVRPGRWSVRLATQNALIYWFPFFWQEIILTAQGETSPCVPLCCFNAGLPSQTAARHWNNTGPTTTAGAGTRPRAKASILDIGVTFDFSVTVFFRFLLWPSPAAPTWDFAREYYNNYHRLGSKQAWRGINQMPICLLRSRSWSWYSDPGFLIRRENRHWEIRVILQDGLGYF